MTTRSTHEIHERLLAKFGDAVGPLSEPKIDPFAVVKRERIVEICEFLKTEPGLEFDFLEDLTAIDWPKRNVIEVVYHLLSYTHRHTLVLKVELDRASPSIPTVEGVWKTANWFEREVYDLFGVTFTGHPDLRRIMLPDDWIGHPLLKDYQEAGGWHGISNERENPLVELKRLDDAKRAEAAAAAPQPDPTAKA
ncbi:NADH-quinone oxidoreductase subunit C [Anaeromyxobacter terrae]|uniref:NADH-quinone oxidoreductase subunit C n=1 Tax=Anaeromyxobacter terrae TaxID=2925406 RepID=UPI001F57B58A|nr:NADH-quinone oxidoreductase subunit C [Anaeromyxobacter sp. SG22]